MIPRVNFSKNVRLLLVLLFGVFFLALYRITYINAENLRYSQEEQSRILLKYETFDQLDIVAENVYIYNFTKNEEIYSKRKDQQKYIASTTKLLTSSVVDMYADSKIKITSDAFPYVEENFVSTGQVLETPLLEKIMLVSSSNNIARMFENHLFEEKGKDLVDEMNQRSKKLGLLNTVFVNATGLDENGEGNISTAEEVSKMAYFTFRKIPSIIESTAKKEFIFENSIGQKIDVPNTNPSVEEIPNIVLSKTGYTDKAGGVLTVLFYSQYNNDLISITVLDSTREGRVDDVLRLAKRTELYLELLDTRQKEF